MLAAVRRFRPVRHRGKAQSEAEQMRSEYTERLSKAKEEATEIVGSATRPAAERSDEILRESSQQASTMLKKAERVDRAGTQKAMNELKDEVADLSVMIAPRWWSDIKPRIMSASSKSLSTARGEQTWRIW